MKTHHKFITENESMSATTRQTKIARLEKRRSQLKAELKAINKEIFDLTMIKAYQEMYDCQCVRLNGEIDIYDVCTQELRGRIGLGFVSETLSVLKSCPKCHGTGKTDKDH